jgi:WD40 repeat protein
MAESTFCVSLFCGVASNWVNQWFRVFLISFPGHCNAITALEVDIPHHLVISSSTDKTIRFWCLETFAQTYVLETGEEVHHMELMTLRRLFYQSHEHIRVWNLNHFHTLFTVLGFEIVTSRRVVSRGFPTRLLLQGKDGAIRIVSPSDGTIITTMFPLETLPEGIVDYAYNPREDRLYVVLSSGAILVFNTRTNPCKLVANFNFLNIFHG